MLALLAEGERLLSRLELGEVSVIAPELAVWQTDVRAVMSSLDTDQARYLYDISERVTQKLASISDQLIQEMNAMRKQHSQVKAYTDNG